MGSWECAHHEDGGFERVGGGCFFLKILKEGWEEQRKNSVLSQKEVGFFLLFTSSFSLSQCSARQLSFETTLCLPAVLPPELWLPCSAPASRSWEKAFGEGSEASRAFAGRDHPRRLCQPPAGSCVLPGAFGETAKIQMLQSHRAGKFPQELTTLLLFYPTRQACPGCLNQSLSATLHFPQYSRILDYNQQLKIYQSLYEYSAQTNFCINPLGKDINL